MLKAYILSYLRHIPIVAGVEASFDDEGVHMQVVLLQRKGSTVSTLRREAQVHTCEKLLELLPKGAPMVLALHAKGMVHRFVPSAGGRTEDDLLRQVLPNAKRQDFYLQRVDMTDTTVLSVIRRERLTELLAFFGPLADRILAVNVGPFAAWPLLKGCVKETDTSWCVGHHRFALSAGQLTGYAWEADIPVGQVIRMGDEEMNGQFALAFCLGFQLLAELPLQSLPVDAWEQRLEEKHQEWQFKRSAVLIGSFFLIVLLVNTYYFMHYSSRLAATPVSDTQLLTKEMEQLQEVLKGQEQLVDIIRYTDRTGKAPLSYVADRLGASVPPSVRLDELSFFPRDEALSRKERKPIYQAGKIGVVGSTADVATLNHWVKEVGMMGFVQDVALVDYAYDEKSARGQFHLQMTLRP